MVTPNPGDLSFFFSSSLLVNVAHIFQSPSLAWCGQPHYFLISFEFWLLNLLLLFLHKVFFFSLGKVHLMETSKPTCHRSSMQFLLLIFLIVSSFISLFVQGTTDPNDRKYSSSSVLSVTLGLSLFFVFFCFTKMHFLFIFLLDRVHCKSKIRIFFFFFALPFSLSERGINIGICDLKRKNKKLRLLRFNGTQNWDFPDVEVSLIFGASIDCIFWRDYVWNADLKIKKEKSCNLCLVWQTYFFYTTFAVQSLQVLYAAFNSPSQLTGWKSNGGDPCGESWKGITCQGSAVVSMWVFTGPQTHLVLLFKNLSLVRS